MMMMNMRICVRNIMRVRLSIWGVGLFFSIVVWATHMSESMHVSWPMMTTNPQRVEEDERSGITGIIRL